MDSDLLMEHRDIWQGITGRKDLPETHKKREEADGGV